jgi:hypothetical protein
MPERRSEPMLPRKDPALSRLPRIEEPRPPPPSELVDELPRSTGCPADALKSVFAPPSPASKLGVRSPEKAALGSA